jgi:hypothetical protein
MESETNWPQKLQTELAKPATIVGAAFAVIGLVGGYYFFLLSEKVGRISFMVEQVQVFDQTRIAPNQSKTLADAIVDRPLTVHDRHGNVINENVYAANIKIWNSGRREIKKDDVRQQLKLTISPEATILDATMVSSTNNNGDQFDFGTTPDLRLTWEHFDPKEGVVLRVVYSAGSLSDIRLYGQVAEVGSPIPYSTAGETGAANRVSSSWASWLNWASQSFLAIAATAFALSSLPRSLPRRGFMVAGAVVCVAALCIWAFYPFVVVAGPPF